MARKKIFWLCTWYPDRLSPFNGDFIQRQAKAAALYNDIYVLHITAYPDLTEPVETVISHAAGLTEHLIYYRKPTGIFATLKSYRTWMKLTKQVVHKYISEQGMPGLVHVHIPVKAGLAALWIKRKFNIPFIVTEHWTIYQVAHIQKDGTIPAWFKGLLRRILNKSSRLLPVSRDLAQQMQKQVDLPATTVVNNVADEHLFFPDLSNVPSNIFTFLHVSNMTFQKNTEGIITSFLLLKKKYSDVELRIAGAASDEIKQLAAEHGHNGTSIMFTGEISYPDVAKEMRKAHALVLFSRFENSPCVIIEALMTGVPVIATGVGGIPELINEHNGRLVESENEDQLLHAMEKMVSGFEGYDRKKIAEQALAQFSYPVIGEKLDEIYKQIIHAG